MGNTVLGTPQNNYYQGFANPNGNLAAGNPSEKVRVLVNKWFGGLDHPLAFVQPAKDAINPMPAYYRYQQTDGVLFWAGAGPLDVDIKQGKIGDCYFLAALGALTESNKQSIRDMFIDNGDGTFTVRFYINGAAEYVTVDRQLPVDGGGRLVFDGIGRNASLSVAEASVNPIWSKLAEKAYAQINESGGIRPDNKNEYNAFRSKSGGIEGGFGGPVFTQVTNRPFRAFQIINDFPLSEVVLRAADFIGIDVAVRPVSLLKNESKGLFKGLVMGTVNLPSDQMGYGLVPRHEYVLVGSNDVSVVLRNPWGGDNAIKIVPWSAVSHYFSYWARAL